MNQSEKTKHSWEKTKQQAVQAGEYSLEETKTILLQNEYYKTLKGKAKNRTLLRDNKKLYNSIFKHTQELEKTFRAQGSYKINYSFYYRILFIVEHNINLERLRCNCGLKYTWTTYCRYCPEYKRTFTGKTHSEDTKLQMRKSALAYLEETKGQLMPRYNKKSIALIEAYGEKHGYRFMHAENGGEYFIRELGYFLDAYDPIHNIVLEVDEKHHFDHTGALKPRDQERQKQIQALLQCTFIRIKYDNHLQQP
jgi:hypothetical protein